MFPTQSVILILLLLRLAAGAAESWPQFRGPTAQGHAEGAIPLNWSESENVKWKTPVVGQGWSSPVVADGRIWLTTALEEGKSLRALALDFSTGKILHDVEVFRHDSVPSIHRRNSYASPTPVWMATVFTCTSARSAQPVFRSKDGQKLWENTELKIEHQVGPGGSPTLYQDRLLIPCDGTDFQYEVALDKMTGKVLWKTDRSAIEKLKAKPEDMRRPTGRRSFCRSVRSRRVSSPPQSASMRSIRRRDASCGMSIIPASRMYRCQ
jgi:hypothetical protein